MTDTDPTDDDPVEELQQQVEKLTDRVEALEDIFAPRLIDRQTKHVDSRKEDARKHLSTDDVERAVIKSPLGHGRDPDTCVAKIKGIITFLEGIEEDDVEKSQTLDVCVTRVQENCAYAVPHDTDEAGIE